MSLENLKREVIVMDAAKFDKFTEILDKSNASEPSEALKNLMARPTKWQQKEAVERGIEIHEALAKIKPAPAIGHTCLIRHQVKRTAAGDVLGLQRADGKGVKVPITAVYLDGLVRTGTSDVWQVQPAGMNTWETINPNHGKSE